MGEEVYFLPEHLVPKVTDQFFDCFFRLEPICFGQSSKRGAEVSTDQVVNWICHTGLVLRGTIRKAF